MHIVAFGWIYVVSMAALAEALSTQGTLLGAFFTFLLYGVLPLSVVLYLMGTPARKKALRRAEEAVSSVQAASAQPQPVAPASGTAMSAARRDPDGGGHTATALPVAPKREEA